MNNSGSPPQTCGFLIWETYVSKSPSTNLEKNVEIKDKHNTIYLDGKNKLHGYKIWK